MSVKFEDPEIREAWREMNPTWLRSISDMQNPGCGIVIRWIDRFPYFYNCHTGENRRKDCPKYLKWIGDTYNPREEIGIFIFEPRYDDNEEFIGLNYVHGGISASSGGREEYQKIWEFLYQDFITPKTREIDINGHIARFPIAPIIDMVNCYSFVNKTFVRDDDIYSQIMCEGGAGRDIFRERDYVRDIISDSKLRSLFQEAINKQKESRTITLRTDEWSKEGE